MVQKNAKIKMKTKNYFIRLYAILISILLLTFFLDFVIDNKSQINFIKDYSRGLSAEMIGTLITLIFVDSNLNRIKDFFLFQDENRRLKNFNNLLFLYFDNYSKYASDMTNPDYEESYMIDKNFEFSRLTAIFNPNVELKNISGNMNKSYFFFFKYQTEIINLLKEMTFSIDLKNHIKLQDLILKYLIDVEETDISSDIEMLDKQPDIHSTVISLIKNHSTKDNLPKSPNIIHVIIQLEENIKNGLNFIEQYKSLVK